MKYIIKIDHKKNSADIEFGKSYISGDFKQSPNSVYYMIWDTLYTSNSDKDYAFLFTEKNVVYKKAIQDVEAFWPFDDGSSLILTDESLIHLDATGKQIAKKKIPDFDKTGICGTRFFGVGENEGDGVLFLYALETRKAISKVIPDIEYEKDDEDEVKETQYGSCTELLFTGKKFVFVYENEVDAIAFDLTGVETAPTEAEIAQANNNRREREKKDRIKRALSSHKYWSERLLKEKKRKNTAEIEQAMSEIAKYAERLTELGIEVPEYPALEDTPKKGIFAKLFKK